MLIKLVRSGGFAAIPLRASVDTHDLAPQEAQELEEMVHSADYFSLPARLPPPQQGADRFQYHLTIEDGAQSHTVEFSEGSTPPALEGLISKVTAIARRKG